MLATARQRRRVTRMRHLLSLSDIMQDDFLALVDRSCALSSAPDPVKSVWTGRSIGLEFRKTSTRTRTSFASAAVRLGRQPIIFGPTDLQTNTGETIEDTVSVLSYYLDALVIRSAGEPEELRRLAQLNRLPIINAMTVDEHPTQAISDVAMLKAHFGELDGIRMLYVGEANNTATALALAACRIRGFSIEFCVPAQYTFSPKLVETAQGLGALFGGSISVSHLPPLTGGRLQHADVIYTTRWQTTGTSKKDPRWREVFRPFRVSEALMAKSLEEGRTVFMHDLPAVRGEDCDASVLDGPNSIAFEQARQKLFTAMAILEWCLG